MGIKRKIIAGFISIGLLLLLSGVISSGELVRLNRTTAELLKRSQGSIELSKRLLDAVQEENTALLLSLADTVGGASDSIIARHRNEFQTALDQTYTHYRGHGLKTEELDQIASTGSYYHSILTTMPDSLDMVWFSDVYKTTYHNLTTSIKTFMISTQNQIVDFATQIEQNAYRASMVGIIALASGFLLIVLFYFLLNSFFIRPVLRIRRGLKNYLERSIPYSAAVETHDEMGDLSALILQLVERSKGR